MIGIICIIDLEYIPYLKKYVDFLEKEKQDYEIIYWKRMKSDQVKFHNTVVFEEYTDLSVKKQNKVQGFLHYRRFLKKTLKPGKYDKLIVLSTLMGMLIRDILLKRYPRKYIFDIRDFTYENIFLFKKLEEKVIRKSYSTVISSEGFRNFLPSFNKYTLCHNFLPEEIDEKREFKKSYNSPLELTFIGAVRHFDLDKQVVDKFAEDQRFKVVFHGYGASYQRFFKYCEGKNVLLTGKYDRSQKERLLSTASIINGYYDDKNIVNRYAVSNKFYDSAIYKIPLWANPNTYIGQLAIKKGIGLNCYIDPDEMYKQYSILDENKFERSCNELIAEILRDEKKFYSLLRRFII